MLRVAGTMCNVLTLKGAIMLQKVEETGWKYCLLHGVSQLSYSSTTRAEHERILKELKSVNHSNMEDRKKIYTHPSCVYHI